MQTAAASGIEPHGLEVGDAPVDPAAAAAGAVESAGASAVRLQLVTAGSAGAEHAAHLAQLLAAVAQRDQRAFEQLYDATLPRVYAVARRFCGDHALAEEVTEDVYVQVWRDAHRFDPGRGVALAWLLVLARSRALDALRRRDEAQTVEDPHALVADEGESAADPLQLLDSLQRESALRAALERLPARERQLIALAFMRGLTHAEIAEFAALPLGTVKTMIRRALATLKRELCGDDDDQRRDDE
jgi:RNA polymerase sigma-70 factor (ECF subfamily)